jgi:hypothetical protein
MARDTRTAGSVSVASNATTGTNATVRFVATKPGNSSTSLSQHGADIAFSQSFMAAQQACCSGVAFPTMRHSADETRTPASANTLAIGRTIRSRNLDINASLSRPRTGLSNRGSDYTNRMAGEIVLEPDPVIEAYKKDVDRTLLRENLKLTPEERLRKLHSAVRGLIELREAYKKSRQ